MEKIQEYVKIQWDAIVIGGGTAGIGVAKQLQKKGFKVLSIEAQDYVTTCANVGCMPSKLLIAPAKTAYEIKNAYKKHIAVYLDAIDDKGIFSHIRQERDRFVGFVKESAAEIENKLIGYATVLNKNTVSVKVSNTEYVLNTKTIVVATGSKPIVTSEFEPYKNILLTNENVFEMKKLPKSLLVVGAGVIGLELGSAFAALGVKTSLYSLDKKFFGLEEEIKEAILKSHENLFHKSIYEQTVLSVRYTTDMGFIVEFSDGQIVIAEQVLMTVGRTPNLISSGVHNLFEDKNISQRDILSKIDPVTLNLKGFDNIFVAGDSNSIEPLLHTASDDATRAANSVVSYLSQTDNVLFPRTTHISIVFSLPYQIAQVGTKEGFDKSVVFDWATQGRSRVDGKNFGKLKLFFKDKKLIGAQNIGPDAEHIAHLLAWQIQSQNNNIEQLLSMPYYHPVIQEGLRTAFREAKKLYE